MGRGKEIILFLHGMTGSYDIWWRQIDALKNDYRIVSVTYPPVKSLEEMGKGIGAIIDLEKVNQFNLVGTSLGGYFVVPIDVKGITNNARQRLYFPFGTSAELGKATNLKVGNPFYASLTGLIKWLPKESRSDIDELDTQPSATRG
jgi:hypothetical protein